MEDVLALYAEPVNAGQPVVCVDERPCVLHGDTRPPIPATPGQKARFDYEYQRHGTCNLFMLFQPGAGWRHAEVTEQRTKTDFAHLLRNLVD
jgi:DDE superfamily endonuclease